MLKVNGSFNTSIFSQGVNSFMSFNWLKEQIKEYLTKMFFLFMRKLCLKL